MSTIERLLRDESGQDLIEHALLIAMLTVGGLLLFANAATLLETIYVNRNTAAENAWQPCPPQPASCS